MENYVENLKNSPMFNLSLSSKELFHSNFLYWLNSANPEAFYCLLKDCFGYEKNKEEGDMVKREYHNYDLCIVSKKEQNDGKKSFEVVKFVLENKFKSMPKVCQLQRYEEKKDKDNVEDCHYVLLSLISAFPDRDNIIKKGWRVVSYKELAISLQHIINQFKNFENYHKEIIKDYISYITTLDKMCCSWLPSINDSYDKLLNVPELVSGLRLEGLYLNQGYSWLAILLDKKLQKKHEKIVFGKGKGDILKPEVKILEDIFLNTEITRAQGLLDIKIKVKSDCILGIQIQGKQYRYVIEWNNGEIEDNWKRSKDLGFPEMFNYERETGKWELASKEGKKDDWYCKFGSCFIYKYVKIGSQTTISDLLDAILKDIEKIKNGHYN